MTQPAKQQAEAHRYAVRLGALVSGFGRHGSPCWITELGRDGLLLVLAHPATLPVERLTPGRNVLIQVSFRATRGWRMLNLRTAIVKAVGNIFSVRYITPTFDDLASLVTELQMHGAAKPITTLVPEAPRARPPHLRAIPAAAGAEGASQQLDSAVASLACRRVVQNQGSRWVTGLLDQIEEAMNAQSHNEMLSPSQQLDEHYAGFHHARAPISQDLLKQLTATIGELFSTEPRQINGERDMERGMNLMETANLGELVAFNDVISGIVRTVRSTIIDLERHISQLLNKSINEDNNPLAVGRVCEFATGIILEHWTDGAWNRPILHDALRDSAGLLNEFYRALRDALDDKGHSQN